MPNPLDASAPDLPTPEPSSSSTWVWVVVVVLILVMLLCGGICGGLVFFGWTVAERIEPAMDEFAEGIAEGLANSAMETPPLKIAFERLQQDRAVIEQLGEPIELVDISTFTYSDSTDSGEGEFRFQVHGPENLAEVHVVTDRIDETWWFRTLDVTPVGGQAISLADPDAPIPLEEPASALPDIEE